MFRPLLPLLLLSRLLLTFLLLSLLLTACTSPSPAAPTLTISGLVRMKLVEKGE